MLYHPFSNFLNFFALFWGWLVMEVSSPIQDYALNLVVLFTHLNLEQIRS